LCTGAAQIKILHSWHFVAEWLSAKLQTPVILQRS
jgi:hypothetical protein